MADQLEVAVLGTGFIGAAMARNLCRTGHAVRAWNRTRAKAEPLAEHGVHVADTAAEAVENASIVLTVVKDGPAALEAVTAAAPSSCASPRTNGSSTPRRWSIHPDRSARMSTRVPSSSTRRAVDAIGATAGFIAGRG